MLLLIHLYGSIYYGGQGEAPQSPLPKRLANDDTVSHKSCNLNSIMYQNASILALLVGGVHPHPLLYQPTITICTVLLPHPLPLNLES